MPVSRVLSSRTSAGRRSFLLPSCRQDDHCGTNLLAEKYGLARGYGFSRFTSPVARRTHPKGVPLPLGRRRLCSHRSARAVQGLPATCGPLKDLRARTFLTPLSKEGSRGRPAWTKHYYPTLSYICKRPRTMVVRGRRESSREDAQSGYSSTRNHMSSQPVRPDESEKPGFSVPPIERTRQ